MMGVRPSGLTVPAFSDGSLPITHDSSFISSAGFGAELVIKNADAPGRPLSPLLGLARLRVREDQFGGAREICGDKLGVCD